MRIPVIYLIFIASTLSGIWVYFNARKVGRRSPAFDFLIATFIPVLGLFMYVSSVRMGLTPPREGEDVPATGANEGPEVRAAALAAKTRRERGEGLSSDPSPSLMAELTAEVRRLRTELESAHTEIVRLGGTVPTANDHQTTHDS